MTISPPYEPRMIFVDNLLHSSETESQEDNSVTWWRTNKQILSTFFILFKCSSSWSVSDNMLTFYSSSSSLSDSYFVFNFSLFFFSKRLIIELLFHLYGLMLITNVFSFFLFLSKVIFISKQTLNWFSRVTIFSLKKTHLEKLIEKLKKKNGKW